MNWEDAYQKAKRWMAKRGWRQVHGKRGAFTQSLFQHTDIELNVLLELLPILARPEHYGLSEVEQQALFVGIVGHDVGKETDEWQQYVTMSPEAQRGRFVPHVVRPLTDDVVADLVVSLGFSAEVIPDATKFINLHMAATRNVTSTLGAVLLNKGVSNRWNILARIVDVIDNICSVPSLLKTLQVIEDDQQKAGAVGPHIRLAYHSINVRGVSSVLLHRAAERCYQDKGWTPILYFSDGTIYVADSRADVTEPEAKDVLALLVEEVREAMPAATDIKNMVVGSPTATFLPKPDLFDYRAIDGYLRQAASRVGRGSFLRKPQIKRKEKVGEYLKYLSQRQALSSVERKVEKRRKNVEEQTRSIPEPSEKEVNTHSERIDAAQPEMLVFKFFKASIDLAMTGRERNQIADLSEDYEKLFGVGSFAVLQSTSTLMPAKEMALVIDPFWALPGDRFGLKTERVELAPQNARIDALIRTLSALVRKAYESLPEADRLQGADPVQIAQAFEDDLIHPSQVDVAELALKQMAYYAKSKSKSMWDGKADRLCPVCNKPFTEGARARADFLDKPESHTNRAVSHGPTGSIVICNACKYERFLQQLLLGDRVAQVLVLTPRNHIGRLSGESLVRNAHEFYDAARMLMSNDTRNPEQSVTLTLTSIIFRNLMSGGEKTGLERLVAEGLDGKALADTIRYQKSEERKGYRKELRKALCEQYELSEDADVSVLNDFLDARCFSDWDELLDAVIAGEVKDETVDEARARVYQLQPQFRVVCETPNMILIPLRRGFAVKKDESDTNAGLRELFALLLVGIALDCSVASVGPGEPIPFVGGEGVARVAAVPAIRDLVGSDWVSLDKARIWLEKIGAASLLAQAADYPERSNLYQILKAMTPGHILRRIEMKSAARQARPEEYQWIQRATQPVE